MGIEISGKPLRARFLLRGELIRRHRRDARPGQDPLPVEQALVEHHLAEGEEVIHGRDQTPGARGKRGRPAPAAAPDVVVETQLAARRLDGVARDQPIDAVFGHPETGVAHSKRLEDALMHEVVQRPA